MEGGKKKRRELFRKYRSMLHGNRYPAIGSLSNQHLCPINRIVSAQLKVGGTESTIPPPARVNLIPSPFDHYTPLKRYVTTRRTPFLLFPRR